VEAGTCRQPGRRGFGAAPQGEAGGDPTAAVLAAGAGTARQDGAARAAVAPTWTGRTCRTPVGDLPWPHDAWREVTLGGTASVSSH